ncbi:hypothetical protein GCM10010517_16320 [Streptosporangium fragile]|uniref:Aquaporin family protein n=1 Tax=Streptosporangium fragile TaxID=46186 RepID=A0ABP6I9D2_9ACTN
MSLPLGRRLAAEATGTGALVAVVVGSGIQADRLSSDGGVALLTNSLATVFALGVLIALLGPVSGAHFNPVVSLAAWWHGRRGGEGLALREVAAYTGTQSAGAITGALLANAMFDLPPVQRPGRRSPGRGPVPVSRRHQARGIRRRHPYLRRAGKFTPVSTHVPSVRTASGLSQIIGYYLRSIALEEARHRTTLR